MSVSSAISPTNLKIIQESDNIAKPRRLTRLEIINILNTLPNIKSVSVEASDVNTMSLKASLEEQLKEIYLTPLAIDDLKAEIARQFDQTVIKPGEVVGLTTADSLGQPITQMALNTFHKAGSSTNISYGISRVTELLNATRKELKQPSVSIFFKDTQLTFDDIIIDKRPSFTNILVKDVVKGIPDILEYDDIMYDKPWWYDAFRVTVTSDFEAAHVLRLNLDVNMLFAYKITIKDVADTIEYGGDEGQPVICVYSPTSLGIIDVYPIESAIKSKLKEYGNIPDDRASLVFLQSIVLPTLDKLSIKGVSGIKRLYPVEASVWQIVKDEKRVPEKENTFNLILNKIRMRITGIRHSKLINLLQVSNIEVLGMSEAGDYIQVRTPGGESPTQIVTDLISKDKKDEEDYQARKRAERAKIIRRPPTDISRAYKLVYADTDGAIYDNKTSTLRTLLANPEVEYRHTYTNNAHEIRDVLGIEAARNFLIKEFTDAIGQQGYINPRHVVLLVDYMTRLGLVYGITFSATKRQHKSVLALASIEQAMDVFKEGSAFGAEQDLSEVSASVFVGQRALIGNGYDENFMDTSKYAELEAQLNYGKGMQVDADSFNDAITQMVDMTTGIGDMSLEALEAQMFAGSASLPDPTISKVMDPPGPRILNHVAGPLVRAKELDAAANLLNQAPCIRPIEVEKVTVIQAPPALPTSTLPFAQPTITIGEAIAPATFEVGRMGLPEEIVTEIARVSESEKPSGLPMSLPPISTPAMPPTLPPEPTITIAMPESPVFDLSDFMGQSF